MLDYTTKGLEARIAEIFKRFERSNGEFKASGEGEESLEPISPTTWQQKQTQQTQFDRTSSAPKLRSLTL